MITAMPVSTRSQAGKAIPLLPALVIVLLPIQFGAVGQGPSAVGLRIAPSDVALALTAAFMPGYFLRRRTRTPLAVLLFGLLLASWIGYLTLAGNLTHYALVNKGLGYIGLVLLLAVVMAVTEAAGPALVLRLLASAIVFTTSIAISLKALAYAPPILGAVSVESRLQGFYQDPNAFGSMAVVGLIIVVVWAPTPKVRRPLLLSYCAVLLAAIVMSGSRGALVSLGAGVASLLFVSVRSRTVLALLIGGALLLILLRPDAFLYGALRDLYGREFTAQERDRLTDSAVAQFQRAPVLGEGPGTFLVRNGSIPHNTTAWLAADLGIAGLILFATPVAMALRRSWASRAAADPDTAKAARTTFAALAAMVAASLTFEASYQRHFWVLLGVALSLRQAFRNVPRSELTDTHLQEGANGFGAQTSH